MGGEDELGIRIPREGVDRLKTVKDAVDWIEKANI